MPVACGVKVTAIVQLVLAASEEPQLLVWAKPLVWVPVIAIELMVRGMLPVLVSVTFLGALFTPTV